MVESGVSALKGFAKIEKLLANTMSNNPVSEHVQINVFHIRSMKTRWHSCSDADTKIYFPKIPDDRPIKKHFSRDIVLRNISRDFFFSFFFFFFLGVFSGGVRLTKSGAGRAEKMAGGDDDIRLRTG